ncbi:hypothetical protein H7F33_10095 [Pedobacter sp. PAMC26386]|nr:hypothetical protein H7F33_10095 [Pedobacter sp. PAMC26386]
MILQEKEYQLDICTGLQNSRKYRITQDITYTLDTFHYHNEIETDVLLTLEKTAEKGFVFTVKLLRQWQLKTDGSDRWDLELATLRKNIVVETDATGKIIRVLNMDKIRELWQQIKPGLAEKYKNDEESKTVINTSVNLLYTKGELEKVLQSSYLYHALLPGLYHEIFDQSHEYSTKGCREIPNAVGEFALPFRTEKKLKAYDKFTRQCSINIAGEIDQKGLDKDGIAELLQRLTGIYNLNTHIEGFHLEDYSFDGDHWITESAQLTQYGIEGTLMYRNLCTALPLNT